jgi:RNA polymerase sigma-70 factor (ECF subfamily)
LDTATDHKLIVQYKKSGDLNVLGELYKPYMPLVYGVALKYLKDEELSKDAVIQIFEELIQKVKTHEISYFKSWLYVVCRNHCLMILRKAQKNITISFDDVLMENEPFLHHEDSQEKEQKLKAMERCLESLNHEQKLSVDLFYLQQKCYAEVAALTGYELQKVKSYIQNGKRNLKICIEKNGE